MINDESHDVAAAELGDHARRLVFVIEFAQLGDEARVQPQHGSSSLILVSQAWRGDRRPTHPPI